jgi:nucleotide-binding universal stress UspA family protein
MRGDREYLEQTASRLKSERLPVSTHLAMGSPPAEIVKTAETEKCDLIAMGTHGHKLIGDLVFGSTVNEVHHGTKVPMLLVRVAK